MINSTPIIAGFGGASTFTGGTINNNTTMASAKSFAVTTADLLTVGGVIIPQTLMIATNLNALSVSTALFIADAAYQITKVTCAWGVAGGLLATLNIEKLTGTTAPGAGTELLTSNIDITGLANTVNTGTLTGTTGNLQLASGDRVGVKLGGTLTGLIGCCVTITLKRI